MKLNRHIRPGTNRRVYLEDGSRLLEADGETVTWSTYWQRRLNDEDVVEVKVSKTEKQKG